MPSEEEQIQQWYGVAVQLFGVDLEKAVGSTTPWETPWGQAGVLGVFPPSGEGLDKICLGHPHGEAVHQRLLEFFAFAARPDETGSEFETPEFSEDVSDDQIQQWLLEYAANMYELSKLCDCEDGVNGAGNPPRLVRSDDLDNSYGLTITFFSEQAEDRAGHDNPLECLHEPLYEAGGTRFTVPTYVLWPIHRGELPLEDPFLPAYNLWKSGVDWAYPEDGVLHYGPAE